MTADTVTISVSNHKGGVGKTTVTAHAAAALADDGYDVLAIDSDPQGTLSMHVTPTIDSLGRYRDKGVLDIAGREMTITRPEGPDVTLNLEQRLPNAFEAFYGSQREDSLAVRLVAENQNEYESIAEESGFEPGPITENLAVETTDGFDLIPANSRLQGIDKVLAGDSLAVMRLRQIVEDIRGTAGDPEGDDYDYILIDTPATVGLLKDSSALAAGNFIIPMQAEGTSVSATQHHLRDIEDIDSSFGLDPNIVGIVPNEVRNDGEAKKILNIIRKEVPDSYLRTRKVPDDWTTDELPEEFWLGKAEADDGTFLDGVPESFSDFWSTMGCRPFITDGKDYTSEVVPFEIHTRVAIRRAYSYNRTLYTHDEECDQIAQFDRLARRVVEETGG